jgi:O-acetyl-ADP-ribose deacetylase (regulator of RNase III)
MPVDSRVGIALGDLLDAPVDAVVSPANSYGWMDGGIDLDYRTFFGRELERRLQAEIGALGGELPVGSAIAVPTGHTDIAWVIAAPTMRVPESVAGTMNVYAACRAALRLALERGVERLGLPGMGTGFGRMHPVVSAGQMRRAIAEVMD